MLLLEVKVQHTHQEFTDRSVFIAILKKNVQRIKPSLNIDNGIQICCILDLNYEIKLT